MSKNTMEIYRTRLKCAHILAEAKDFRQAHSIIESTLDDASNLFAGKVELAEVLLLAGSLPDEYIKSKLQLILFSKVAIHVNY